MIRIAAACCAVILATTTTPSFAQPPAPGPAVAPMPPMPLAETPWMNTQLSPDARAELVIAQMTQDEELQFVKGYFGAVIDRPFVKPLPPEIRAMLKGTAGIVPGIPRLGIPSLFESDAGIGIANSGHMRIGDQAIALPSGLAEAATWNPDLAFSLGNVIGREARNRTYNVMLAGALNLAREPRGGRTFEYGGEDPLLAGTVIGEAIRGIQSEHVISTTKHYALNDQETGRGVVSSDIDEASMRESDLLAFEIAIEHGNPGAVMCAYNRVNGVYSCENDFLLNRVLKHDWAYPGFVLSDWGGVHSTVAAANGGLDQESASGFDRMEFFGAPLVQALKDGTVTKDRLHDMVHRILRSMFANGLVDDPATPKRTDYEADRAVVQRGAEEAIVLLKNTGNVLPLAANMKRIAIIGAHADFGMLSGGGSSQVIPIGDKLEEEYMVGGSMWVLPNGARIPPQGVHVLDPPSPLMAIRERARHATVVYDDASNIDAAAKLAQKSDIAIVFAYQWMTEGQDVADLSLRGTQDELIQAVAAANPKTIVVLETGGPVLMPWLDKVPAVLEAWYAGSGGSRALSRILFGDVDASGRLPLTFPAAESQLPRPLVGGYGVNGAFDVQYTEGADVGYRWFERQNETPLFPFGYGLSYTQFKLDGLKAVAADTIAASVNVTNTGTRDGSETVQLYATPPSADGHTVPRLVGFAKIALKPGESRRVPIAAEPRLLATYDMKSSMWQIAAGEYRVTVGESSTDLRQSTTVTMVARTMKP